MLGKTSPGLFFFRWQRIINDATCTSWMSTTNLTCLWNIKAVNYGHHAELNDDRSHYDSSFLCFGKWLNSTATVVNFGEIECVFWCLLYEVCYPICHIVKWSWFIVLSFAAMSLGLTWWLSHWLKTKPLCENKMFSVNPIEYLRQKPNMHW